MAHIMRARVLASMCVLIGYKAPGPWIPGKREYDAVRWHSFDCATLGHTSHRGYPRNAHRCDVYLFIRRTTVCFKTQITF